MQRRREALLESAQAANSQNCRLQREADTLRHQEKVAQTASIKRRAAEIRSEMHRDLLERRRILAELLASEQRAYEAALHQMEHSAAEKKKSIIARVEAIRVEKRREQREAAEKLLRPRWRESQDALREQDARLRHLQVREEPAFWRWPTDLRTTALLLFCEARRLFASFFLLQALADNDKLLVEKALRLDEQAEDAEFFDQLWKQDYQEKKRQERLRVRERERQAEETRQAIAEQVKRQKSSSLSSPPHLLSAFRGKEILGQLECAQLRETRRLQELEREATRQEHQRLTQAFEEERQTQIRLQAEEREQQRLQRKAMEEALNLHVRLKKAQQMAEAEAEQSDQTSSPPPKFRLARLTFPESKHSSLACQGCVVAQGRAEGAGSARP